METRAQFNKWIHSFGRGSSAILCLLMFGFPVLVSAVTGIWPDIARIWPAFLAVFLALLPWYPAEFFGYMPVMGPGAMYLSYITGSITNLRMPSTVGTINILGIKPNTDLCHTLAIIACAGSIVTSILILAAGMLLATPLQPILNAPTLQPAFDYVLPALFGGLCAQCILKSKKQFLVWLGLLAICTFLFYCTKLNSAYHLLIVVVLGGLGFYLLDYKKAGKDTGSSQTE